MAKITFTGDPSGGGNDPAVLNMYGIEFTYNHPVEVTDAFVISKLRNHNHFKFEDDQSSPPKRRGRKPGSKNKPKPKPEIVENEQNFEQWQAEPEVADGQEQN